mmetsp:Transcript_1106/g.1790  ORF Transcript_1106/g.1790 Transcript_1106/m.1790 type:complete len:229 (+) Transcript_1106:277-963(+)
MRVDGPDLPGVVLPGVPNLGEASIDILCLSRKEEDAMDVLVFPISRLGDSAKGGRDALAGTWTSAEGAKGGVEGATEDCAPGVASGSGVAAAMPARLRISAALNAAPVLGLGVDLAAAAAASASSGSSSMEDSSETAQILALPFVLQMVFPLLTLVVMGTEPTMTRLTWPLVLPSSASSMSWRRYSSISSSYLCFNSSACSKYGICCSSGRDLNFSWRSCTFANPETS